MLVFLVNPLHTMRHQARFWLLRVLGRIFAAPFFYVGFADFWLADQLNSLVPVFIDAQYFVCFYATDFQWMENSGKHYPLLNRHLCRLFCATHVSQSLEEICQWSHHQRTVNA
uniref:Putative xenotropic and polytropic retrovirus receptor 1 n=1 Tax=Rhipicephalus microplus TaxID=6941 RepID=A0A6M2D8X7_RHIMP